MKRFWSWMVFGVCLPLVLNGQGSLRDSSISMTLVVPSFAIQAPLGDLKDRFGLSSSLGLNVIYKNKSRWFLEAQGCFIFGSDVKQPGLFSNLVTSQGEIIGTDGKFADVRVFERGYYLTFGGGKMLTSSKPNPNSGFFISGGVGYIRHKIRVEDKEKVVPAVREDYAKGYDRLTSGFCLRQSAGYIYIGNHRLVNFYCAIEAMEGFTQSRRTINFDEEKGDTQKRIDVLMGVRIGWILPIYKAAPEKYYLY